ncbi:MAG TPA: 2OG-Fe(II) oxygenase [Pyrinomonadaceae bacterium]|nr:2OG-Fe(II) oxygenase [Pyrinomonadaceae bacterium]
MDQIVTRCERTALSLKAAMIDGCAVMEDFADPTLCAELLDQVNDYRSRHTVPVIERRNGPLPLKYSVIDGDRIAADLPDVMNVYERVTRLVQELWRGGIEPLPDRKVACNINITQPGGSYRYHYDRNAVTAILYLNATSGGETECYPNYRLSLAPATHSSLQQKLDRVLQNRFVRFITANQLLVRPRPGRLLIMQGNRCLHCVRPVRGSQDRINIVMSYDRPHARFDVDDDLNRYLYSPVEIPVRDPNYRPS